MGAPIEPNFKEDFKADIEAERVFLDDVNEKIGDAKYTGPELETELSLMVKHYNEQLNIVARLSAEVEFFDILAKTETNIQQHAIDRGNAVSTLRKRRILLNIVRNQILEALTK